MTRELSPETEAAMEQYIDELLRQEKSLVEVQDAVKARFAGEIKSQLGEDAFQDFRVEVNTIRTVHHAVCDREKTQFVCAGLFEDF